MTIETAHQSITALFEQNQTFEVPKYQREYSWDANAIEDFVEDLEKCLQARLQEKKRNHFFGGIVSVRRSVAGSSRTSYEVIDGQQRISSFVMLAASVVSSMKMISAEIESKASIERDKVALEYLRQTISKIESLYLTHRYAVGLKYKSVPKLTLSEADNNFFQATLAGGTPAPERSSHERIKLAWDRISVFLSPVRDKKLSVSERAILLQRLIDYVLTEDCTVIFMWVNNRYEAYQIFQVLNDRGVGLTDGDLLRARTMELLDHQLVAETQDELAKRWDGALEYPSADIDKYLLWYFASHQGWRPKRFEVPDDFMEFRFNELSISSPITHEEANHVLNEVKQIDDDFALLNQLNNGDWPYPDSPAVTKWDIGRLSLLVRHLKHTNVMPLLMALRLLEPNRFAEAVASLERFVFRYKTIGNAHIGPATKLYHEQAQIIRRDPGAFRIGNLRKALGELIKKNASTERFSAAVKELAYSSRGGNGHIRYLMTAIEDYLQWFDEGAQGTPVCRDKIRLLDIATTTLEHIYPQNQIIEDQDLELETVKHTIGNLTILNPEENDAVGNKDFSEKCMVFQSSNLRINRHIAESGKWTKIEVEKRTVKLAEIAEKVFIP